MNTDITPEKINPKIKNGAISRHISHISLEIEMIIYDNLSSIL